MSPTLPTNFNDTDGLMDYGKDLGITVGVGFFVPALVLSLLLIVVFIKFCGGKSDKREEFTNTARTVLIVAAVAILGVAVATCAVGWSYNKQCHDGIVGGTDTLQGVITSTSDVMLNVNLSVNDLKFNLLTEVNKTATIAANITTILTPLENILHVVDDAHATLTNLSTLATTISNNITAVKRDLNNLHSLEADGVISGVPSANDVPNIDNTYTSALNTSVAELQSVTALAHNLTNEVNDTLNYVANTVSDDLINEVNDYSQRADEALSYFTDFHDQITDTNETFNEYSPKVVHYSSVRESVVAAILVLPLSLAILSLIGVVFRLELLLKISAAFCFAFMFWYFLLAGVNYAGYYTLDQFCQKQDEIVGNALSISNSDMQVPGTNVTIVVSEKVKLLLKCSGNTSLIDIFEFRFLVDQATGEINNLLRSVDNEVARLNQTDQYKKALDSLQSMENNSVSLDFLKNASLPTVHAGLNNVSQQLYNTINNPVYNSSLEAVNNITNNLQLTNSTTVHYYYGPSNITTLNCTQDPYDKLSQSVQQDLCTKAATAITLTNIRNRAIAESSSITGNITDINDRLYGFEASLPTVFTYQNRTSQYVTSIRGYLNDAYNRAMGLIRDVQRIMVNIADVIVDGASAISESTQCAYVGDAYSNLSSNVCDDISPSLQVITAMMVLGAAVFFFSTIVSMWTVYKIHRDS